MLSKKALYFIDRYNKYWAKHPMDPKDIDNNPNIAKGAERAEEDAMK